MFQKTFFYIHRLSGFFLVKNIKMRRPNLEHFQHIKIWLSLFENFNQKKNLTACECKKNVSKDILLHSKADKFFFLVKNNKMRKPNLKHFQPLKIWLSLFENFNQKKNLIACECKKNVSKD